MPYQIATIEAAIRAALHADIRATWFDNAPAPTDDDSPYNIYDDPPEVPGDADDLPRAFVLLRSVEPDARLATLGEAAEAFLYDLTLQAPKPTTTTLHAAKMAAHDELVNRIMDGYTYHGHNREYRGATLGNMEAEASEDWYSLTVRFAVVVLTENS